jgi:multidrug efflux pump subunit AcrA (membrane-fusion protein)
MKNSILIAGGLMAALGIAAASAQTGASGKSNKVVIDNCLISAYQQAQVPAQQAGVLDAYEPNTGREGVQVVKGDVLAHLDKTDLLAKKEGAELAIEVAEAKANSDAELEVAKATKAVAEKELEGAKIANKRNAGTVPLNELRRMELTVDKTFHEIRLREVERGNAALEAKVKRAELKAVNVELDRREVKSPLDGVVVERLKHEGEWVQPGETIIKIVRLDRLRVEGFVPANQYLPQQMAGAPVVVSVELPGGKTETAEGTIEFVSPVVEASGEYRVWTEIENRKVGKHWLFAPGTSAKMQVTLTTGNAAPVTRPVSTRVGRK